MTLIGNGDDGRLHSMKVEIKHGSVLCAKCNATLRTEGVCPKCKYPSAHIKIGFKGKPYRYYTDDDLKAFDYGGAIDALIVINREIAKNIFDPTSRIRTTIEARRFFSAWEQFMKDKESEIPVGLFAPSTYYMYDTHYRLYLAPMVGNKDIRTIDGTDTKKILMALIGKSRKYQINVLSTMHSFMSWAKRTKKWIKELPEFPVFKGKPLAQSARRESLTIAEQEDAFALIPEEHRSIFIFASEIGCRPGEAGLIRLEDINRNGMLVIRRTFSRYIAMDRTKEGANRPIYLSTLAKEIVQAQRVDPDTGLHRTTGLLFRNPCGRPKLGPYRPAYLRRLWRKAVGKDFPDLYAATRTSFSTQLAETADTDGLSEKEWRVTTGHTSEEAADRYYSRRGSRQSHIVDQRRNSTTSKIIPIKKTESE